MLDQHLSATQSKDSILWIYKPSNFHHRQQETYMILITYSAILKLPFYIIGADTNNIKICYHGRLRKKNNQEIGAYYSSHLSDVYKLKERYTIS